MKKKILAVLMAILMLITFAACSTSGMSAEQQKLVGTWLMYTGEDATGEELTYTFTEDGSVISKMGDQSATAEYTVDANCITITYQGTETQNQYEYADDGALLMMTPLGVAMTFYKQ